MGFFSDLKEDLSQASGDSNPNRVMTPEEIMAAFAAAAAQEEAQEPQTMEDAAAETTDAESAPDTGTTDDGMPDISLEEMLKNIDNIAFPEEGSEGTQAEEETPVDATIPGDKAEDAALEEMLAAAIAALPEREEDAAEVMETADLMESEAVADAAEPGEPVGASAETEIPGALTAEESVAAGKEGDDSLLREPVAEEQPVIEGSVEEEMQAAEKFRQELIADMAAVDELQGEPEMAEPEEQSDAEEQSDVEELSDVEEPEGENAQEVVQIPEEIPAETQQDVSKTVDQPAREAAGAETAGTETGTIPAGMSVIAAGMQICGNLNAGSPVKVEGLIEGNVNVDGKLSVTGQIHGDIHAAEIYADGARINGDVMSEGAVKLGASAVVKGNITAKSAAIAGAVKGDIDVHGPIILDSTAIVVGNIKFKSIQINNGAVIEGMCLQCYADVSPTSFFDED